MTFFDAWIGPAGPFAGLARGERPSADGPPARLSPLFPSPGGRDTYFLLRDRIADGILLGMQTDWGSHAALVKRADLERILSELYGPPGAYEAGALVHLADQMRELRAFVAALPPDERFTLVAEEF